jgi:hypothetical protein
VVDVVLFLIFQNGEGRKKPLLAFRSLRGLLDPLFFFVEGILGWDYKIYEGSPLAYKYLLKSDEIFL